MGLKFTFLRVIHGGIFSNEVACKAIIEDQGGTHTTLVDPRRALALTRGRISPTSGFALITPDDSVVTNYFELMKWFQDTGHSKI